MVNDNELERKRLDGMLRNLPQLMFSHFPMRFVFDPVNFSPLLGPANNAPKIYNGAGGKIDTIPRRFEPRFCH